MEVIKCLWCGGEHDSMYCKLEEHWRCWLCGKDECRCGFESPPNERNWGDDQWSHDGS